MPCALIPYILHGTVPGSVVSTKLTLTTTCCRVLAKHLYLHCDNKNDRSTLVSCDLVFDQLVFRVWIFLWLLLKTEDKISRVSVCKSGAGTFIEMRAERSKMLLAECLFTCSISWWQHKQRSSPLTVLTCLTFHSDCSSVCVYMYLSICLSDVTETKLRVGS